MAKTIAFDFDGVISSYDGWKGFDVFGEPNKEVIECMWRLKEEGKYIIIFTTRPATQKMADWLNANNVPYDEINRNKHNPQMTSCKPVYECFVDDRAVNYSGQDKEALLKNIKEVVERNEKT